MSCVLQLIRRAKRVEHDREFCGEARWQGGAADLWGMAHSVLPCCRTSCWSCQAVVAGGRIRGTSLSVCVDVGSFKGE